MSSDSVSIHTAILPTLNVSLHVALTTELPLQRDVMEWIREDGELINKIIQGISILTKNNEICHAIFPNDNMIYRRLIVYIFAHTMLCRGHDSSFLVELKGNIDNWKNRDYFDIIQSHQSIKDTLSDLFIQGLKVEPNPELHPSEDFFKLVAIDTVGLCAHLTAMVTDNNKFKRLLTQRGHKAQALLNLLQARLDFPLEHLHKPRHVKALLELSRKSGLYPQCLALRGVEMDQFPVAHGGFGDVYKGQWQEKLIAVKVMKMYQNSDIDKLLKAFSFEAVIWRQLSHPNILPFYGVYRLEDNTRRLCLTAPWMENGNLVQFLQRNPDTYCVHLALDVALGLEHLHSREPGIVHGDLKGLNVLITRSKRACLADFGLASVINSKTINLTHDANPNNGGTVRWQAPELFDSEDGHSTATDIYAFACVCYEMFSGETPFYGIPVEARIILSVLAGRRPAWPSDNSSRVRGLSDEMRELVETCWDQKPTNRPTATQIVQQLRVLASGRPDQRQQDDFSLNHLSHAMLSNQAEHPFVTLGNSDSQIALVHQLSKKRIGLPCPPLPAIASREEDRPTSRPTSLSPITNTRIKESSVGFLNADLSALDITKYIRRDPGYPYAIGSGGGNFYKAIYISTDPRTLQMRGIKVVVKILTGTSVRRHGLEERVKREVATWRLLEHPNITPFLGIAYLQPGCPPGLVFPYMQRRDFLAYIGRRVDLKRDKAIDIARGLQYLHGKNIVHGDIRVDSVSVSDDGIAQLNDFGTARILDVEGFTTITMHDNRTTAPELMPIIETQSDCRPTFQSDIFSLAMLLLQLFHGPDKDSQRGLPYNHIRFGQGSNYSIRFIRRVHAGERPMRERYHPISDQHWALIEACWRANPSERPDITYVLNAL